MLVRALDATADCIYDVQSILDGLYRYHNDTILYSPYGLISLYDGPSCERER
jgi:hypothetical protein